jgi:hypothetical protein
MEWGKTDFSKRKRLAGLVGLAMSGGRIVWAIPHRWPVGLWEFQWEARRCSR